MTFHAYSRVVCLLAAILLLAPASARAVTDPKDNLGVQAPRTTDDVDGRLDTLFAMVQGEYTGTWPSAFSALPDGTTVKAWAVWKRVDLPAFSSRVLYHEVRENGPTGRILRQRVIAFGDEPNRTHNYMNLYPIFLDHEPYSRADLYPEKLAKLTPANMAYFGRGCQANLIGEGEGFLISADKSSCVILYPDGKSRYNQFEIHIQKNGFAFFEAAYDLDGKFIAGSHEISQFTRIKAAEAR